MTRRSTTVDFSAQKPSKCQNVKCRYKETLGSLHFLDHNFTMNIFRAFRLLLFVALPLTADGTDFNNPPDEQKSLDAKRMYSLVRSTARSLCIGCVKVEIVFHIVGASNSNAARLWTDDAIQDEVDRVNQHFSSSPFQFTARAIRTARSDWGSTRIGKEAVRQEITAGLRVGGIDVANVFVTDGTCITTGGYANYPRDYGFFPPNQGSMSDYIFLCATDMGIMYDDVYHTILTHELGHWLGLLHTFEGDSCGTSNDGDGVADTPQHLESAEDDSCDAVIDTCLSQPGVDPVNNFMNSAVCRNQFTPGQLARMYSQFNAYRRQIEPCLYGESAAVFEVQFDSKPDQMEVGCAMYDGGRTHWTELKIFDSEPNVSYANQVFQKSLCLAPQTMYSFSIHDATESGFDSPGYASLKIRGKEIERLTTLDSEWTATFVVTESCNAGQSLMVLDMALDGGEDEISWEIRTTTGVVVLDRAVTARYLQKAYRRIYFEKCLRPGAYEFTVYDTGGDGMYGTYQLRLGGEIIKAGGGRKGFLSSETTSLNVSNRMVLIACFSGSSTVTVKGKGTIEMRALEIGDLIHVGNGVYETVYSFGHYQVDSNKALLQVQTADYQMEISDDHMIYTQDRGPIPAGLLVVGDYVLDAQRKPVKVESISPVISQGVFAPFTASGNLVVGGILVSSFIAMDQSPTLTIGLIHVSYQWLAHTFEFPHRIYCALHGCGGEAYDEHGINTWMPLGTAWWLMTQGTLLKQLLLVALLLVLSLFYCVEQLFLLLSMLFL